MMGCLQIDGDSSRSAPRRPATSDESGATAVNDGENDKGRHEVCPEVGYPADVPGW
jgi:hypothetical protein